VLARVPGIHLLALGVHVGAGDTVRLDERPVQDDVADPLALTFLQDLVEIGCLGCEDVDGLVEVAVAGGLRDPGVAGQTVHAAALAEPAQHHDRLAERAQRAGALRCPQRPAVGGEQTGKVFHDVARDVERGNIGDQREASGCMDSLVVRTVLPGALRLSAAGVPPQGIAANAPLRAILPDSS